MINIVTIVGARPQFIKAAVLSRLVRNHDVAGKISEYLVHTGQHYDSNMSDVFFTELEIPTPDENLGVGGGSHGVMTAAMISGIERILLERKPDLLLVYGDTNSTLAGSLAASKLNVPVAHVEAGLRSFNKKMPEEQNRIISDHLSTWHFCPTAAAVVNLSNEGIVDHAETPPTNDRPAVKLVGDIMYDASLHYRSVTKARPICEGALSRLGIKGRFRLLTLHRAENTDNRERLSRVFSGLERVSDIPFVFPVHPRTRKAIEQAGIHLSPAIKTVEPLGYLDMVELEAACETVVTDSGGVQKEAYFFHKPCITLRPQTEWIETVEAGWNRLVDADPDLIEAALSSNWIEPGWSPLYGDGDAGLRILKELIG